MIKLMPRFKAWFETEGRYVFGLGTYTLLKKVEEKGSLKSAVDSLGMSYRYAWGLLKKVEERIGMPVLKTFKGGRHGGGGAVLTEEGRRLLGEYSKLMESFTRISEEYMEQKRTEVPISRIARLGRVLSIRKSGEEVEVNIKFDLEGTMTLRFRPEETENLELVEGAQVAVAIEITRSPA